MLTEQALKASTSSTLLAHWPYAPPTKQALSILTSFTNAYARTLVRSLNSIKIAGTVSGGSSAPSGPVIGAVLSCTPGSLSATGFDIASDFEPPAYDPITIASVVYKGSYTPWMRGLVKLIADEYSHGFTTWCSSWFVSAYVGVGGGSANWVASTPPVPGPWVNGTITTPMQLIGVGQGASGPVFDTLPTSIPQKAKTVSASAGDGITTVLNASESNDKIITAICKAYTEVFTNTVQTIMIGNGVANGTALPGGVIAGGVISNCTTI